MQRTLLLSFLVVGAAVALGAGAYSALAGAGPVTGVAGAVIGADEPGDVDALNAVNGDDVDNDVDGDSVSVQDADDNAEGAHHIAEVIEGAFGAEEGSVWALHEDEDIGFGALFKLHALAAAMGDGTSVEDLLATIPTDGDGRYEFGFGELRNALTDDQRDALESGPKNLGQLVSASHPADNAGAVAGAGGDGAEEAASAGLEKARGKFTAHVSSGHGPPEGVPAHGRP